ncbi:MAG: MBL fold metallo-hydrolase [Chloroflexota bacterium]|nr:MBL fold metallo-hydrolase [Chloroflexota bacterium]
MRFATVYDNRSLYPHLISKWGFACLVGDDLLFDTGGDGRTLLSNMAQMGIDQAGIGTVVLSHAHGDHTGGLAGLLAAGVRPTVYVPRSFPARFKVRVRSLTTLVEVHGPVEIRPGIHTTGEVGRRIVEQALVVETEEGLVVVTGCAHPGGVEMVRCAQDVGARLPRPARPYLVLGGFHLGGTSRRQVERFIADFHQLGVQKVAPCHCTGDRAMRIFAEKYGEDFIRAGVGCVITIGSREGRAE